MATYTLTIKDSETSVLLIQSYNSVIALEHAVGHWVQQEGVHSIVVDCHRYKWPAEVESVESEPTA